MTKLSISLAAVILSVTFGPAANAYGVEPETQSITLASLQSSSSPIITAEGACAIELAPVLASILNLPQDWQDSATQPIQTSLACAEE